MKKTLYILSALAMLAVSCDSFLDMKPIDPMTTDDDVFAKRATTEQYLYNVYSYVPKYYLAGVNGTTGEPWVPCADEADVVFNNDFQSINNGAYNPSSPKQDKWQKYYQGIREANYFMANVHKCMVISEEEREQYYYEARCLRAYFYFLLMRVYGPVPLVGDEVYDAQGTFNKERSTWEKCVQYVCDEMDAVSKKLPDDYNWQWRGKVTSGMALAVKARLLLYSASPLYNSSESIYADYKNAAGENLFPTQYSEQKWRDAADANKAIIDLHRYDLVVVRDPVTNEINPYESLYGAIFYNWDQNTEVIFGRTFKDQTWYQRCTPRALSNGWGGFGATQKQVDAYAMSSGLYPIDGYVNGDQSRPNIVPGTGYTETGVTNNYTHPYDKTTATTFNMYVGREPRFYMDITWNRMKYTYNNTSTVEVSFRNGGNSGPGGSQNYSTTGYLVRKLTTKENDPTNSRWKLPFIWPNIRLSEIYLNYAEALIECDINNPDILTYWNKVRARAGVPDIDEVYPEAMGDLKAMRKLIRRERQVELAFEAHRYFDVRRWMIAEETNNGFAYGMYVNATADTPVGTSDFWQRKPSLNQARVFSKKDYFFPVSQACVDRDNLVQQSPFWK